MSLSNVEIIRAAYEAFNSRDWDALFRHADPDFAFTYRNPGLTPDAGTPRGRDEVIAFSDEYGGAFESLIWKPERFVEAEDRVVVPRAAERPESRRVGGVTPSRERRRRAGAGWLPLVVLSAASDARPHASTSVTIVSGRTPSDFIASAA
jgi:ketosteroid isomerase-like protein